MNLSEVETHIEDYWSAGITPELQSSPGVGKSDTIRRLRDKFSERDGFEWGLGIAFIATYSPIDLLGYMIPQKIKVAQTIDGVTREVERTISTYTTPPWMFDEQGRPLNDFKRSILFLDEWDKGEPDVKKTCAELVLHGGIGPHKLGKHVSRVAASNRTKDRSGSTKTFDFLINRMATVMIEPEFGPWEDWANRIGMPPLFIVFAKKHADKVFNADVPKEQGPWMTPRSFVKAVQLIVAQSRRLENAGMKLSNFGADDKDVASMTQAKVATVIGEAGANEIMSWLRMRTSTPDFADIVKDPDGTFVPATVDARTLVAYECSSFADADNIGQVCKYIKRMQQEFHVTFAKAVVKRNHKLILNPDLLKFVKGNTALLNAIGDR
jgi:hypothetical protein